MNYTETYHYLKSVIKSGTAKTDIPESGISVHWAGFRSLNISFLAEERDYYHKRSGLYPIPDELISENQSFTYPVFINSNAEANKHAILLLHGLNERSWSKYMVWAYYLSLHTRCTVILFPIAFHMNRSPESWGNPRAMMPILTNRKQRLGEVAMSSVANVALSERLDEDPLRFFTSGQQSAADLAQLTRQIKDGNHAFFKKGTSVDIFAYSIGAFLAQILLIGNPEGLYSDSRLFLFCGGAFFDQMNGVSKLIMDQHAFSMLRKFYINELEHEIKRSDLLANSINRTELGRSFLAMLTATNLKIFREDAFKKMKSRIRTVALEKDTVIPATGVLQAMNHLADVEVMDFPYAYSHENPFPVMSGADSLLVDKSFKTLFSKAAAFLQ